MIAAALSMPGTIIENVPPLPGRRNRGPRTRKTLDLNDASITENTRLLLPALLQPERRGRRARRSSRDDRAADRRRLRRAPATVPPGRPGSDVSLRAGLHREARGHGGRDHRAAGDVQRVLRRPLHVAPPGGLRQAARGSDAGARGALRPAQHRVERRPCRRDGSDLDREHPEAARCGARRRSRRRSRPLCTRSFGLRTPASCPGVDASILDPRSVWNDRNAYDTAAARLRDMFRENFDRQGFGAHGIEAVM